ncbi:MAG: VanZ family protein, partial [Candidatus Methylomirabilia bacterium]
MALVNFRDLVYLGRMPLLPWLFPLAWIGIIYWGSTEAFSAEATGSVIVPLLRALFPWAQPAQLEAFHITLRKAGHLLEFAILAGLWYLALSRSGKRLLRTPASGAAMAFALAAAYAIVDELHQGSTGVRTASALDVMLDWSGSGAATILCVLGWQELTRRLAATLLWTAAAGGTVLLILHLLAGVPSGWLLLSTPAAWI